MAGRKSLKDELQIIRRYSELTPAYFLILKSRLTSENKEDQNWAVERLDKAFVKMIPQEVDARVTTISQILNSLEDEGSEVKKQGVENISPLQDQGQESEAHSIQPESGAGTLQAEPGEQESTFEE